MRREVPTGKTHAGASCSVNPLEQEGDKMATSSGSTGTARFLTPESEAEIVAFVKAVPLIGSPDLLLPDSLGVKATAVRSQVGESG